MQQKNMSTENKPTVHQQAPEPTKAKTGVRGRPFQPGNNAGRGRPKGSRNRSRLPFQEQLDEKAEAIIGQCIDMALKGDIGAIRLCVERILPPRRDALVEFELPEIKELADVDAAINAVFQTLSAGEITPTDAAVIQDMLRKQREAMEIAPLEDRLRKVEAVVEREEKRFPKWGGQE
ncbi:MAG TPA: hypothetical protein VFA04_16955 [Bryobacteraceae bacterium]|nr:hypothetical protein [Bryobacteraceae bacterium]